MIGTKKANEDEAGKVELELEFEWEEEGEEEGEVNADKPDLVHSLASTFGWLLIRREPGRDDEAMRSDHISIIVSQQRAFCFLSPSFFLSVQRIREMAASLRTTCILSLQEKMII